MNNLIDDFKEKLKEKRNAALCKYKADKKSLAGSLLLNISLTILVMQVLRLVFSILQKQIIPIYIQGIQFTEKCNLLTFFLQLFVTFIVWWRYKQRHESFLAKSIRKDDSQQYESPLDIFIGIIGVIITSVIGIVNYWFLFFALLSILAGFEYLAGVNKLINLEVKEEEEKLCKYLNILIMKCKFIMGFFMAGCFILGLLIISYSNYNQFVVDITIFVIFIIQLIYHIRYEPWRRALIILNKGDYNTLSDIEQKIAVYTQKNITSYFIKIIIKVRDIIALLTSFLFSPYITSLLFVLPFILKYSHNSYQFILFLILQIIFLQIFPFTVYKLLNLKYHFDDCHVNNQSKRYLIYLPTLLFSGLLISILIALSADENIILCNLAYLVILSIVSSITSEFKISAHASSIAAISAGLIIICGYYGIISAPLVGLVCWARMVRYKHSANQVVGGAILGFSVMILFFGLHKLLKYILAFV